MRGCGAPDPDPCSGRGSRGGASDSAALDALVPPREVHRLAASCCCIILMIGATCLQLRQVTAIAPLQGVGQLKYAEKVVVCRQVDSGPGGSNSTALGSDVGSGVLGAASVEASLQRRLHLMDAGV